MEDENQIIRYGLIVVIVIFVIIAIMGILMIDFSENENSEKISIINEVREEEALKQNIKKDMSGIVNETNKDEEFTEEELKDMMNQMLGKKFTVTQDSIIGVLDEVYYDLTLYIKFDEKDILEGMFYEIDCVSEDVVDSFFQEYSGTMFFRNATRSGLTIYGEYPISTELKFLTRKEIEERLSVNNYLEYQN